MKEKLKKSIASSSLFIQFILLVLVFILMLVSWFIPVFITVSQYLIVFLLFIMAYNNIKHFHRKYFTIIYILVGILLLLSLIG